MQIILCALDIPFTIRFGDKKGSSVKAIISVLLVIMFIIIFLIDPVALTDILNNFLFNGEMPPFMGWILPVISIASFVVSAMISSKLYMKGVEQYYK